MLHVPLNLAPSSNTSLPVIMSPLTTAVPFKVNNPDTLIVPCTAPPISAVWAMMSPFTAEVSPHPTLALVWMLPTTLPSTRRFPEVFKSPSKLVSFPMMLLEWLNPSRTISFLVLLNILQ